jgi:hydroxypyruvate isomerase
MVTTMIKLSACIEMLFREVEFLQRIVETKRLGLDAYEFWSWANKDLDALEAQQRATGLKLAALAAAARSNTLFSDRNRQNLVDPANRADFVQGIAESVEAATRLGCPTIIVTVGNELPDRSREEQRQSIIDGLIAAAPLAERGGVTLVVEPLNTLVDHKGYFLWSSREGFEIVRAVGSPHVKLLYDIYHQQIMEGNLIATIEANIDLIGHFHMADVPGRHEPGTGEINYLNVLRRIAATGYQGYVGLELRPTKPTHEALRDFVQAVAAL